MAGKAKTISQASVPYRTADYLQSPDDVAAFLEALIEDGHPAVITKGLRSVADAMGGISSLADKTGLSRETLYRTLSENGNPRLDTLTAILSAFGLRLSVKSAA